MPDLRFSDAVVAKQFSTLGKAKKWLEDEKAAWLWLTDLLNNVQDPTYHPTGPIGHSITLLKNFHEALEAEIASRKAKKANAVGICGFFASYEDPYQSVLYSESKDGQKVLEIKAQHGLAAASAAYAFSTRNLDIGGIKNIEQFVGVVNFSFPIAHNLDELRARLFETQLELKDELKTAKDQVSQSEEERQQAHENWCVEREDRLLQMSNGMITALQNQQQIWETTLLESKKTLEGITAQYKTYSQLKAAVSYWEGQAKSHAEKEQTLLSNLVCYFVCVALILPMVYLGYQNYLFEKAIRIDDSLKSVFLYFVSGSLLVLTTVAFWVGRLISRVYLSEKHLANDAAQRAVMTNTYLALIPEDGLDQHGREIILNALFRQASDGVVKEDSSETNLAMVLSKLNLPRN